MKSKMKRMKYGELEVGDRFKFTRSHKLTYTKSAMSIYSNHETSTCGKYVALFRQSEYVYKITEPTNEHTNTRN